MPEHISEKKLSELRRQYLPGARVQLVKMDDRQAPPPGTLGTVRFVDDVGTIHVNWDNGSTLGVVYEQDSCQIVSYTNKEVEKITKEHLLQIEKAGALPMVTIYDSPKDFPGEFVARIWTVSKEGPKATDVIARDTTLEGIRSKVPQGMTMFPRTLKDGPCIKETWI